MKIKLSKSQWEEMGKKAGWIKKVAFKSHSLSLYKEWLASNPPPKQVEFVDAVYALCEKNYERGGDVIVETESPEDILGNYKTMNDVRRAVGLHVEQALNARWGEDTDPELQTYKDFQENWN